MQKLLFGVYLSLASFNPNKVQVSLHNPFTCTSPKPNMDTQNGGLETVDSSRIWPFLVYMLDFRGVYSRDTYDINTPKSFVFNHFCWWKFLGFHCSKFQGRWRVKSPQQCGVRRRPWKMWGVWGRIESGLVVQQTYNHPPKKKKDHIFLSAFCGELNMMLYPFDGSGMKNGKAGKFLDLSGTNVNKCILKLWCINKKILFLNI